MAQQAFVFITPGNVNIIAGGKFENGCFNCQGREFLLQGNCKISDPCINDRLA
ncbi:MAG: hypothetical protein H7Y86_17050 [Rhizobacter sp.]|nr:hypothetical protein [Ferruginibacter sp.]